MKKEPKVLTALVLAGLLSGVCASGFAAVPEEKIFGNYQDLTCQFGNDKFLVLRVWEQGTKVVYPVDCIGATDEKEYTETSNRGLLQVGDKFVDSNSSIKTEEESIKLAAKYFYDLMGQPKNGTPVMHLILDKKESSEAYSMSVTKDGAKGHDISQYFQARSKDDLDTRDYYVSLIRYYLPSSGTYSYFGLDVLPKNGNDSEAHTTFFVHELGHTFGISDVAIKEDVTSQVGDGVTWKNTQFNQNNLFNRGLHGAFGETSFTASNEGKLTRFVAKDDFLQCCKDGTQPNDTDKYFYVVDEKNFSGNYFTGTNVDEVLDGAKIAWPNESDMPAVPGVPINGMEVEKKKDARGNDVHFPELCHFELQNSMMSHQTYITWGVFMEAELAVLQDLGYTINRRKFFGGSMYKSGTADVHNTVSDALVTLDGNSEDILKDNAYVSSQDYAVGYHVYGSYNDVNNFRYGIKPTGSGAVGIRVEGVGNTVNLNKDVEVNGAGGTGVMFTYGKNHKLTVNSPIKVTGNGGIALRFDFGDNILGNCEWYRGSYINTHCSSKGIWYDRDEIYDALTGPLMKEVTINQPIEGKKYAIYIADNAYVQKVTINADIKGDIVSEWNPVPDATKMKLHDTMLGDVDPATLLTDLQMNTVTVKGNINGYHSLKMTVVDGKTVTVNNQVAVHSLLGNTERLNNGNLTFSEKDGIIAVKDTLNLKGTIKSGDSVVVNLLGTDNNHAGHKFGTVETNSLHVITDDIKLTQIGEIESVSGVKNLAVVGTSNVSNQIVASNKEVERGLEEVANILHDEDGALKDRDINVAVAEGNLLGELSGVVCNGELKPPYTERPNQSNTALSQMNAAAIMGWRAQNNDMNKRLGELRMKNGEKGVWARMSRGENKEDATKRQFNLYQVGYDQEIGKQWILGAAFSMTKGNANTYANTGSAKGEDKSGAFSLYASRLNNDGTFVDLVAKYGKTNYDVKSYMNTGMGNYDYSTPSMSVSAEVGKRLKKGAYWMEPQAEFTFGMVKSANYTTSKGINAEQDRFNSAVGRIGAVFGRDLPEGNIYVRASFLHDFAGNSDLHLMQNKINRSYTNDLGGSWWEFGIGTNLKTGKHSYIYADVEKTCGGKMQTPWRWNLGARWSF